MEICFEDREFDTEAGLVIPVHLYHYRLNG